jgi:hypothetical protein
VRRCWVKGGTWACVPGSKAVHSTLQWLMLDGRAELWPAGHFVLVTWGKHSACVHVRHVPQHRVVS